MSSMEHQEVNLGQQQNQDLIWDLDSIARRELAERFIKLFENRLCVYSESTRQLYTNYNLHFPADYGRKMVVLPNPYAFPVQAITEIHLAGHHADPRLGDALLIDSHDAPVAEPVWALYEHLIARTGPRPTLIERDDAIPPLPELLAERERAHRVLTTPEALPCT